jgi:hypothetical protein
MFKTHLTNIAQIQAIVAAFGVCFFHGDGNMYDEEKHSDFRKDFSNPKNEASGYRVKFTATSKLPGSVEELDKMLMDSRTQEVIEKSKPASVSAVKTVTVPVVAIAAVSEVAIAPVADAPPAEQQPAVQTVTATEEVKTADAPPAEQQKGNGNKK